MSVFSTGGIYYNDWRKWQSDDMQRTSMFASADRFYTYYAESVLPKRRSRKLKSR